MTTNPHSQWLKGWLASTQQMRLRLEIFLAKGPAYHYVYGRWRWARWRSARCQPAARLRNREFWGYLDLNRPELAEVRQAVAAGDESAAHARLAAHFRARTQPRWFFAPDETASIAALVPAEMQAATLRQADAVCQNTFQFRHAPPVTFEAQVDWAYQPDGNVDWNWDLNRHMYFDVLGRAHVYSGDARYARKFRELLLDWLARNRPSLRSPAWSSVFEVAFRINSWLWAFYFFRQAAAFDEAVCRAWLEGLLRHGLRLDEQLELHAANNHLLLEAKALALLGLVLPELRPAARWRRRGLALVFQEVRSQVGADGVHSERVTHYQQAIGGELLELFVCLENNHQPAPAGLVERFRQMITFQQALTKPNGQMPLFGDSGLEDSHTRFSATAAGPAWLGRPDLKRCGFDLAEVDYWLLGPERVRRFQGWPASESGLASRAFRAGGYITLCAGQGQRAAYLAFDVGRFGDSRVPGHGHADALSFDLHAQGQTWLMDPGVYGTWVPAEWRNYFRSTRAHNTVMVDEQDQSVLVGTRLVYHPARVTLHQWLTNEHIDLADASHDGYARLAARVTHRRQVLFVKPDYWVVIDQLEGAGEHTIDLLFHFTPGQTVQVAADGRALAGAAGGPSLSLVPVSSATLKPEVITGATDPIQGWAAPYSGEKQPAPVLRYRYQGRTPFELCTLLHAAPAGRLGPVAARALPVRPGPGAKAWPAGQVTGLTLETEQFRDLIVIDRGTPPGMKLFEGYTSQGRLAYIRQRLADGETLLKVEL